MGVRQALQQHARKILPLVPLAVAGLLVAVAGLGRIGPPAPRPTDPACQVVEPAHSDTLRPFDLLLTDDQRLAFRPIEVTGYTSCASETDSTPHITASMAPVRAGSLALSRDLLRTFTPGAPFDFGDWVLLPGVGIFVVEDTMHPRWGNRADIWFADRTDALRWGCRPALIARLPEPLDEGTSLFALGPRALDF